ncbi:MAG: hypothetical protein HKM98_03070, partial [Gammaproteobacteria bacterium]|nr:hypothetical protein [Gammaproteobacteria bacterium]
MRKLMEELRRRQVFRTIGLYVGGIWITLQVAEVLLPVYEAPDWIMKGLLTAGIIGLPIAIAMAWFYDLTSTGLHREVAADEAPATTRGRGVDFVVIGILAVALTISLIINFLPQEPVAAVQMEPVSVLIADFDNGTGDSVFNGALEQALTIAIEESSFITAFDRTAADRTLQKISEGAVLDESGARLVAAREGIDVVIRGELAADKNKYRVGVVAMTAETGDVLANLDSSADGRSNVLGLVSELAVELREKLGDATAEAAPEETFTTESIEAMHDYVNAQRLARDGHDE